MSQCQMFCYQCEQTVGGQGCEKMGVCGKDPDTAAMQDLLIDLTKGMAQYAHRARLLGKTDPEIDRATAEALFSTVTNVNFDVATLEKMCRKIAVLRERAEEIYDKACIAAETMPETLGGPTQLALASSSAGMLEQARQCGIRARLEHDGDDVVGLQELLTYGLKGAAAYADHAEILGYRNNDIYAFFHKALNELAENQSNIDTLVALNMECGQVNLKTMELLDKANTSTYGQPEPTQVRITPVKGKAILVSGHDLKDLAALLKQTEGKNINVYTHGEMLPCNAYPELKKYPHLVGNYGGAWQDQQKEFEAFPGSILMTTNCIQRPRDSYKNRLFTCGLVQWPDVAHIDDGDFSPVIATAQAAPGFVRDEPEKRITIGFAGNAVLQHANAVIDAVKSGAIRHFFLVGGCDGAKPGRNYYTELAETIPQDCIILTLACGKFRFNKLEFGDIGGIPRLLDVGQCNDAYSAIRIATALAEAFDCGVNDLPLSMVLSWYEQKAVAILLTLLSLGIKNIKIGPSLPAFISPTVLNVLVENFNLAPTTTADADLKEMLGS